MEKREREGETGVSGRIVKRQAATNGHPYRDGVSL